MMRCGGREVTHCAGFHQISPRCWWTRNRNGSSSVRRASIGSSQNRTHAPQQTLAPFDYLARLGKGSAPKRPTLGGQWRLSAAQKWNVSLGNDQRGECGSVLYCKLRKNVVEVNGDGSCGEIELPPHLFVC